MNPDLTSAPRGSHSRDGNVLACYNAPHARPLASLVCCSTEVAEHAFLFVVFADTALACAWSIGQQHGRPQESGANAFAVDH
mmetsp:Transcript_83789/g.242325  ORF Transcript_83789/g.242325 Transcript_83789/m.242325 type:complete len:82 (+) Transcript_83789:3658-3903(+)